MPDGIAAAGLLVVALLLVVAAQPAQAASRRAPCGVAGAASLTRNGAGEVAAVTRNGVRTYYACRPSARRRHLLVRDADAATSARFTRVRAAVQRNEAMLTYRYRDADCRAVVDLASGERGTSCLLRRITHATPAVCKADVLQALLIQLGREESFDDGVAVNSVRCSDLNDDGNRDALFAVSSGGTAGNVKFGIVLGGADGGPERLATYRTGYKIGVAVRRHRPEVLQPIYAKDDPNCCPSAFRLTPYRWTGSRFVARKSKRLRNAPKRFYVD